MARTCFRDESAALFDEGVEEVGILPGEYHGPGEIDERVVIQLVTADNIGDDIVFEERLITPHNGLLIVGCVAAFRDAIESRCIGKVENSDIARTG